MHSQGRLTTRGGIGEEDTDKDAVSGGGGGVICYLNVPKRFYGFVGGVVDSELFHYHTDLIPSKLCDSIVERII